MNPTLNLISVGIAVAAMMILGFAVLFNNRKSATNSAFLLFSFASVLWSVVNFAQYQVTASEPSFLILRAVLFLGVWHSFSFFHFCFVFPEEKKKYPAWYSFIFFPMVAIMSLVTLFTPLVFARIAQVAPDGSLLRVDNGPLIPVVALLILFSVAGGMALLIRKTMKARPEQKRQFSFVLVGMFITFALLMAFNFLLPAFLSLTSLIPLGAVFLLPFVILTFYAISRYHLLDIKVISTEILAFILSVVTLLEVISSRGLLETVLRSGVFVLVLVFSIFLIKSVWREVEQRAELEVLNGKLDAANKQLEELSRFKSQLLSLASHQIRSPLAAIKGFAGLITQGLYGPVPDKVKEAVEKMKNSTDELLGLINTLLDLRKVDEGKMDYQFAPTDLRKLAGDVVELLKPLAETKKLELTLTQLPDAITVNADAEKLKQVVQNLADNAIKYTPSGFVRLDVKTDGPIAVLTVTDSGLGIPETLVPHLFEEFIRDERVKQQILGTGLGLYIARKIAEAHGGKLSASSPGEGKGSTFQLTLPIMPGKS